MEAPRGSSGFTRQWGSVQQPSTVHRRVTLTETQQVQRAKDIVFNSVRYYTEAFLDGIKLACMFLPSPPSIPVLVLNSEEDVEWCRREIVSSGQYGDTSRFRMSGKDFLVKRIRHIVNFQTIPGVPRAEDVSEEAVREGAVLLALSAIGFPAMVHQQLAFFVDISVEPPIVHVGMEFIDGCVLAQVVPPLSLVERLLAVADLAFLLEYFALYKISHNDLHLKNIMVRNSNRRIVLIDYGAVSINNSTSSDFREFKAIVNFLLSSDNCSEPVFFTSLVRKLVEASTIYDATEVLRKAFSYGPYFYGLQVSSLKGTQWINFPMPTEQAPRFQAPVDPASIRVDLRAQWAAIDLPSAVYRFFCKHLCTKLETKSPHHAVVLRWFATNCTQMAPHVLREVLLRCTAAISRHASAGSPLFVPANFAHACVAFAMHKHQDNWLLHARKYLRVLLEQARGLVLTMPSLPREIEGDDELIDELLDRAREEESLLFLESYLFPKP